MYLLILCSINLTKLKIEGKKKKKKKREEAFSAKNMYRERERESLQCNSEAFFSVFCYSLEQY